MKRQEMAVDPFAIISKKDRKLLTRRSDLMGLTYLLGHFSAIGCTGFMVYLTSGTILMLTRHDGAWRGARVSIRADARMQSRHGIPYAAVK